MTIFNLFTVNQTEPNLFKNSISKTGSLSVQGLWPSWHELIRGGPLDFWDGVGEFEKCIGSIHVPEKNTYTWPLPRKLSCMFGEPKNEYCKRRKKIVMHTQVLQMPITNYPPHPPPSKLKWSTPLAGLLKNVCFCTKMHQTIRVHNTIIVSCPSPCIKKHLICLLKHYNYHFHMCCAVSVFKSLCFCGPLFHFQMSPLKTAFSTVCMSEENYECLQS